MTRALPPYRTVRELVHTHVGRPAVVMGGAPSLPDEIEQCPKDALYLSANEHGVKLIAERFPDRRCSYIVALDKILDRLDRWGVPIVSRHAWADYVILRFRLPDGGQNSGMAAAWLARLMGCAPIIVIGVGCYSNGQAYWHAPKAQTNGFVTPPKEHIARWMMFKRMYPAMYRTIGDGPLSWAVFDAQFDPNEKPEPELIGMRCEVRLDKTTIRHRAVKKGEVLELDRIEASSLARKKIVRTLGFA